MRILPAIFSLVALGFSVGAALAAPGSINDCEKIQAADAYNRCLASFGPVPRGHTASARDFGGDGDLGGADTVQAAAPEAVAPEKTRHAHGYGRRHSDYSRHASGRYRHYGHYRGHGRSSAYETHSHGVKRLAFNVVSGHSRTR